MRLYSSYGNVDSNTIRIEDCAFDSNEHHGLQLWNIWKCVIRDSRFTDHSDVDIALFGQCQLIYVNGSDCSMEERYGRPIDEPYTWFEDPENDEPSTFEQDPDDPTHYVVPCLIYSFLFIFFSGLGRFF